MWRTIRLFCSKSIERRASFFRASGGTGKTPRRSSVVTAVVFIVILQFGWRLRLESNPKNDRISARKVPGGTSANTGATYEKASGQWLSGQRVFIESRPSGSNV